MDATILEADPSAAAAAVSAAAEAAVAQASAHVAAQAAAAAAAAAAPGGAAAGTLGSTASVIAAIFTLIFGRLPWLLYRILSITVTATITLELWSILGLMALLALAAYILIRYRYHNTYTRLKTPAPAAPRAPFDLQPDVTLDDTADRGQGYPDEFMNAFLSSIKVFGYLDKPVFHELARHLQTRKLKPGEILFGEDSDDRDFYVVVDGRVQIFVKGNSPQDDAAGLSAAAAAAPMGHARSRSGAARRLDDMIADFDDDEDDESGSDDDFPGHHLLNEVRSGETVSSLFTILSLFTEDFELSTLMSPALPQPPPPQPPSAGHHSLSQHHHHHHQQPHHQHQQHQQHSPPALSHALHAPHLPSQLNAHVVAATSSHVHSHAEMDPSHLSATEHPEAPHAAGASPAAASGYSPQNVFPSLHRRGSVTSLSDAGSIQGPEPVDGASPISSIDPAAHAHQHGHAAGHAAGYHQTHQGAHPSHLPAPQTPGHDHPHHRDANRAGKDKQPPADAQKQKPRSVHPSIIARAATQTTLAVIPAQAFRKLTEKFPNAAAHIVQVILTRFQRVTFLTLYRYLGLSKELLKIERQVNQISGYGLPAELFPPSVMHDLRLRTIRRRRGLAHGEAADPEIHRQSVAQRQRVPTGEPVPTVKPSTTGSGDISMLPMRSRRRTHRKDGDTMSSFGGDVDMSENEAPPRRGVAVSPNAKSSAAGAASGASAQQAKKPTVLNDEEDGPVRDAVFQCIAQLIGMRKYNGPVPAERSDMSRRTSSISGIQRASFSSGHGGLPPIADRLYYSRSRPTYKPTVATTFSMGSSSRADVMMDDAPSPSLSSRSNSVSNFSVDSSDQADVEILFYEHGQTLVTEGERNAGLYFVLDGVLEASMSTSKSQLFSFGNGNDFASEAGSPASGRPRESSKSRRQGFLIHPGGLAGYLSALTGHTSFVTIKAKTDVHVGFMSKHTLDKYIERFPDILLCLAKRLVNQLSPLVLHIDVALEWGQINAGQVLCRQGDPSSSIYIVLTGRLRAIVERKRNGSDVLEIQGEYGQLESVGEMEVLMDTPRTATIHAIRDTEIAIMPKTLFNALAIGHPEITMAISRIIAARSARYTRVAAGPQSPLDLSGSPDSGVNNVNLKTVAILPVTSIVPVTEFADRLRDAFNLLGESVAVLTNSTVMRQLGKHAFTRLGRLKLMSWLSEQEDSHRLVLYVADGGVNSPWTQRCVRQADCILLVGLGDEDPAIGEFERLLIGMKTTARKELVLLHNQRAVLPGSTAQWLKNRVWIHAHHHIQMRLNTPSILSKTSQKQMTLVNLRSHFERYYTRIYPTNTKKASAPNIYSGARSDFARLARRLLSKSIGLVLGGGGARGLAHVGIIRAFEEAGIPVDMVGGTSIGSFVGGCYARENDHVSIYGRAKMLSGRIISTWRTLIDLTYPVTSLTTGHEFNRAIWKAFLDTQIEDCWISYFAVTTNVTHSRMEVHQSGYMWRYIRASMSLAGYMPPICDHGNMLLDGGYINNLPADIMRSLGAQTIIAVDVGLADDTSPVNYGDSISGWWVLLNRLNPFGQIYGRIPGMADIQSRLTYVSSVKQLEEAKSIEGCLYIHPPITPYTVMDFGKFHEIVDVGYKFGQAVVQQWHKDGTLARRFGVTLVDPATRRGFGARRASI